MPRNKYGTIDSYGVSAQWQLTDEATDQEALADIAAANGNKDSHGIPAKACLVDGTLTVIVDDQAVATLPDDWSRFVNQVKKRGPLSGTASIQRRADGHGFRLVFNLVNA